MIFRLDLLLISINIMKIKFYPLYSASKKSFSANELALPERARPRRKPVLSSFFLLLLTEWVNLKKRNDS